MKDNAYAALAGANTNIEAYCALHQEPLAAIGFDVGAASRARTHDILITGQALYQLSYDSTEHNLIIQRRKLRVQP